ncbi:MAG: VOC family protein [Gammaproteobacteria bacterium]
MKDVVSGLGGVFVYSDQPERLTGWFEECFGLIFEKLGDSSTHYTTFWAPDSANPGHRLDTTLAIMRSKTGLPRPKKNQDPGDMYGDQHFMVNLRVRDLDALVESLQARGETILGRQDEGEYGLFAWLCDPDGNRIELYEPRHGSQSAAEQ